MPPTANLVTKIKVQLKLAISRLRMVQQRDEALNKVARRTMAQLLDAGKEESARIRVENIIRSDIATELHEILELYCELLLARAGLLDSHTCDPGLEEAVQSIVYAAPKTEIKELQMVRQLLGERYGKDFVLAAMANADGKVSPKVVRKLRVTPPSEELVRGYLTEIARTYGVPWPRQPSAALGEAPSLLDDGLDDGLVEGAADGSAADGSADDAARGEGGSDDVPLPSTPSRPPVVRGGEPTSARQAKTQEELARATPPKRDVAADVPGLQVNPPTPSTDNIHPRITLDQQELKPAPAAAAAAAGAAGAAATTTTAPPPAAPAASPRPSLADPAARKLVVKKKENVDDELARRFAQLKR